MKDQFRQFYGISDKDIDDLFKHAWFVLDTNVLLNAYETHEEGKEALFSTLEKLKQRIWVPHHVALEFQRNRLKVIKRRLDESDKTQKRWCDSLDEIKKDLVALELHRRNIGIADGYLTKDLDKLKGELVNIMKLARKTLGSISLSDHTRDKIDALFAGRVGLAPANQKEIDDVYEAGARRFANNVPPGFHDTDKSDSLSYVLDGIRYERQYGDLLIWHQTLAWAQSSDRKALVFVTSDNKPDWWSKDGKAKIGPHPELRAEMARAGVEKFWMFQLPEFLEYARTRLKAKVSDEGLNQVRDAVERSYHSHVESFIRGKIDGLSAPVAATRVRQLFISRGWNLPGNPLSRRGWEGFDPNGIPVNIKLVYSNSGWENQQLFQDVDAYAFTAPAETVIVAVLLGESPAIASPGAIIKMQERVVDWQTKYRLRGAMVVNSSEDILSVMARTAEMPSGGLVFYEDRDPFSAASSRAV